MEPTFTQRRSETSEWLSEALGPEKLDYAYKLLNEIRQHQPGGIVLHSLGRQYAGEALPRWSIGHYQSRDDQFFWEGPPDPHYAPPSEAPIDIETFAQALVSQIGSVTSERAWQALPFHTDDCSLIRILVRCDGEQPVIDLQNRPGLARPSIHSHQIPLQGLVDELARQGDMLLCLDVLMADNGDQSIRIELPCIDNVATFLHLLTCISAATKQCELSQIRLQGFPPPVDPTVAWTTITPDPAVVEINMAPSENVQGFFEHSMHCYDAAEKIGLSSYRLQYNGVVSDSGGGGQFTIGGSSPLNSPFLRYPALLPRLIRYLNAHPALSYWFAPPSIGSSSQSPRPDEGVHDSFHELKIALEHLEKTENPQPEFIWRNLSPFMADISGNQHRSELNIEKLWNPFLPGRGCLGLVEFRAFRMPRRAETAAAIAALLRAIVAMLIREDKEQNVTDHGDQLHDRYALPFYLRNDLELVFEDLDNSGFGLGPHIERLLVEEPVRVIARNDFLGYRIELQQALEFWPLIGDVSSQERGGSRLIDGSTSRLQISIRPENEDRRGLDGLEVQLEGHRLPMRLEQDQFGPVMVFGLRYRSFMPVVGLHPGISPLSIINFVLADSKTKQALKFSYHEWHPDGIAYPGLPVDLKDAEQRRRERVVFDTMRYDELPSAADFPRSAISNFCVDLRRL